MRRYAAFLRGVSPMNARMPALKASFEAAGFTNVRTLLSSGNVVFDARAARETEIQRRAEAAMEEHLGRCFLAIVRPIDLLTAMLADDPFQPFRLPAASKRVVTFLRARVEPASFVLPITLEGARILAVRDGEAFSAYVPNPRGPAFMRLIEKTFGPEVTTRTWETVRKVAAA